VCSLEDESYRLASASGADKRRLKVGDVAIKLRDIRSNEFDALPVLIHEDTSKLAGD
jgi:hypothetical protein